MDIVHYVLQNKLNIVYGIRPGKNGIEVSLNNNNEWAPYEQVFGETVEQTAAKHETDYKWHLIREKRNELLGDTDWTQIHPDLPAKSQYAAYRKQLRQLPQKHSNPDQVTWPVLPA